MQQYLAVPAIRRAVSSLIALAILVAGCAVSVVVPSTPAFANGPYALEAPFWITNSDGHVTALSGAGDFGSLKGVPLNRPIVGMAPTISSKGYWLVATDGGVFSFGDAQFFGSTGALSLNKPIVAITPTKTGNGYWMVASDGGIFAFGDAQFYGSTGAIVLNKPIVAMTATPSGKGYWLIASDGGIFSFGDAQFFGSTGAIVLNKPIISMAPTATGKGYWLAASDGGIFTFGDATFQGSGAATATSSYDRVIATNDTKGYWLVKNGGDTEAYGTAAAKSPIARGSVAQVFDVTNKGEVAVDFAIRRMDTPYLWGGNGPGGFDCSGLTSQAWRSAGVGIARVANDQYNSGTKIPLDALKPGDLLFWGDDLNNSRSIDHVGMYVGGGWAINSGGQSKPSRVSMRSVVGTKSWMFPYGVRPAA